MPFVNDKQRKKVMSRLNSGKYVTTISGIKLGRESNSSRQNNSQELIENIKSNGKITEREIILIKNRLNKKKISIEDVSSLIDPPLKLTKEQNDKGEKFLKKLAFKKNGEPTKNSPFANREEEAIKSFIEFEFIDFYDNSNGLSSFKSYLPVYRVIGRNGQFEYYYDFNGVHIIG